MHPSPQYLEKQCYRKYEQKKRIFLFGEIHVDVFVKNRVIYIYTYIYIYVYMGVYIYMLHIINEIYKIMSDSRDRGKENKGHQKFSVLKWTFFLKKVIRKSFQGTFFPAPQTRRQVSAYVLKLTLVD